VNRSHKRSRTPATSVTQKFSLLSETKTARDWLRYSQFINVLSKSANSDIYSAATSLVVKKHDMRRTIRHNLYFAAWFEKTNTLLCHYSTRSSSQKFQTITYIREFTTAVFSFRKQTLYSYPCWGQNIQIRVKNTVWLPNPEKTYCVHVTKNKLITPFWARSIVFNVGLY
jgi:hypothetical protein